MCRSRSRSTALQGKGRGPTRRGDSPPHPRSVRAEPSGPAPRDAPRARAVRPGASREAPSSGIKDARCTCAGRPSGNPAPARPQPRSPRQPPPGKISPEPARRGPPAAPAPFPSAPPPAPPRRLRVACPRSLRPARPAQEEADFGASRPPLPRTHVLHPAPRRHFPTPEAEAAASAASPPAPGRRQPRKIATFWDLPAPTPDTPPAALAPPPRSRLAQAEGGACPALMTESVGRSRGCSWDLSFWGFPTSPPGSAVGRRLEPSSMRSKSKNLTIFACHLLLFKTLTFFRLA